MFAHVSIFFAVIAVVPCIGAMDNRPLVLVILLDGFRYDYFNEELTPNIMKIQERDVYSEYMNDVVPTFTFVNHWTIATGWKKNLFIFRAENSILFLFFSMDSNRFATIVVGLQRRTLYSK